MANKLFAADPADTFAVGFEGGWSKPFEWVEEGKADGYYIDLINAIAKNLDHRVEWMPMEWEDVLSRLRQGDLDAATYIGKTPERAKDFVFNENNILNFDQICYFVLKDRQSEFKSLDVSKAPPFKSYKIGKVASYYLNPQVSEWQKKRLFKSYRGNFQMIEALRRKKIDMVIAVLSFEVNFPEEIVPLSPCGDGVPRYIAFSKKSKTLADKFAKAYEDFRKTDEYRQLIKKWGVEKQAVRPEPAGL